MTRYTVTAERSGQWWALQCVEVPGAVSQVRRLDQAEDMMREAIAWVAGVPEDSIEIDVEAPW
jgi:predicted RNase H-like HicB family nuclease